MTAKTALAQPRVRLFHGAALLAVLPVVVFGAGGLTSTAQASEGRYLNWQNKSGAAAPASQPQVRQNTVQFQGQTVPVPPSPYGQVGDPYARVLNWGTKGRPVENAQPVASAAPVTRAPVQAPAQNYATAPVTDADPAPSPRRASNYRDTWPQFAPAPMASTLPEPVHTQPLYDDAQPVRPSPPMVRAETPQPAPQSPPSRPAVAPVVAPQAQAPAPVASSDGSYQVPATSKYAARINAARNAETVSAASPPAVAQAPAPAKPDKLAKATPASKSAPAKSAPVADMPVPVTETASDGKSLSEDRPFVPGQHYTDASEAPRLYSLHRDYGLKPDPITLDSNASGAILDTSRLDAAEAKAEKAESEAAGDAEPDDAAEDTKDKSADATPQKTPLKKSEESPASAKKTKASS